MMQHYWVENPTPDIVYTQFYIPLQRLTRADILLLPTYLACITDLGTKDVPYEVLGSELSARTGSFSVHTRYYLNATQEFSVFFLMQFSSLLNKVEETTSFCLNLLGNIDFARGERLFEIINEGKHIQKTNLASTSFALTYATKNINTATRFEYLYSGLAQYRWNVEASAEDIPSIQAQLSHFDRYVAHSSQPIVGLACRKNDRERACKAVSEGIAGMSALPYATSSQTRPQIGSQIGSQIESQIESIVTECDFGEEPRGSEKSSHPSTTDQWHSALVLPFQVNYNAWVCPVSLSYHNPQHVHFDIAYRLLSNTLWSKIRIEGGAYGVFGSLVVERGFAAMGTYRDPHIARSYRIFKEALYIDVDEQELKEAIIGTVGSAIYPQQGHARLSSYFKRRVLGIDRELRQKIRDCVLSITKADVYTALKSMQDYHKTYALASIAHQDTIDRTKEEMRWDEVIHVPY